jgi:coproporphyrinogen III oxidase-like Fe-S oxidoreductase
MCTCAQLQALPGPFLPLSILSPGLEHYELSNYARPGHRCRHNMVYWQGLPFYALGLGSASYLQVQGGGSAAGALVLA